MVLGSVKVLDLQLQGNQVNLLEKPTPRDQLIERRKVARSLRPCTLRRPMSATPYQEIKKEKKTPSWGRPQSAGSSSRHGQNKLAAKLSNSTLNDPESCLEFGTSYESSQFLHSLMGSCSPIEGVSSPSPQPSFDNVIAVGAHLEPGLTGKPPLPPTPQPPATAISDDSISLKFQRWFPDAILDSEILSKQSLTVDLYQKQKDETEPSDSASVTDCAELSDKELPEKSKSSSNVTLSNGPVKGNEEDCNQNENKSLTGCALSPPEIVVHKPNHYGCHVVTEEFTSAKNRCMTPDYGTNPKSEVKRNNKKFLSLSDLKDMKNTPQYSQAYHTLGVHSDSDIFKSKSSSSKKVNVEKFENGFSDSELYEKCSKKSPNHDCIQGEFTIPPKVDALSSTYSLKSIPTVNKISDCNDGQIRQERFKVNSSIKNEDLLNKGLFTSSSDPSHASIDMSPKNLSNSPPLIKPSCEEGQFYYNHMTTDNLNAKNELCSIMKDKQVLDFTVDEKAVKNVKGNSHHTEDEYIGKERHAYYKFPVDKLDVKNSLHFNEVSQSIDTYSGSDSYKTKECTVKHETADKFENRYSNELTKYNENLTKTNKGIYQNMLSFRLNDRNKMNDDTAKIITRRRSVENFTNKTPRDKSHMAKDLNRAASVPPSFSKSNNSRNSKSTHSRRSPSSQKYKKLDHSLSFDDANSVNDKFAKDSGVSSYEDIVSMISVLEQEEMKSRNANYSSNSLENNEAPEPSSSVKEILNFLDDVEKDSIAVVNAKKSVSTEDHAMERKDPMLSSRLGSLLSTETPELAKQVMTLSLQLEESRGMCAAMEERHKQTMALLERQKVESKETNARHQAFINQLLKEKQQLAVQYETALQDLKGKHETAIRVLEESHKIELKKNQDKFNAAEKIRRDKWIDAKTKKIKELTVRGLEPELERMAVAHQEEIGELRRVHQRQLTEAEAAWARRGAAMREQEAAERQAAVQRERDTARHRVEQEIMEIEKSYQEQRRRLLEEVRQEKEMVQRQSERIIAEKQAMFDKQVIELQQNLQNKMVAYEKQHQDEILKIKESLESDKKAWKTQQMGSLEEKEAAIREEMKLERDRHIELVISRLEVEAATKEQAIDIKFKKLRETYAIETSDLENELKEARCRLKEARSNLQRSDDANGALAAQLSQAQAELAPLRQTLEKLRKEYDESIQQYEKKVLDLQLEMNGCKQSFQVQVNKIHNDKEKELQQVYSRVREAINKKEEALQVVSRQRDAVLEQCSRLEKLLQNQRAQLL